MDGHARTIRAYVRPSGTSPFEDWISALRDKPTKAKIFTRIDRMKFGNFGDCKSVGQGVFELRIHFGPGFRIYFALVDSEVVLLLAGGSKASQSKDVGLAQRYWKEFQNG